MRNFMTGLGFFASCMHARILVVNYLHNLNLHILDNLSFRFFNGNYA